LASRGRYHFSTEEAAHDLGVSLIAARSALRRLKKKGLVASPYRGFHVIVPPEYQSLGCLPADQFVPQLMGRLDTPYYAALLTAARYHGAAHQQPQLFQVVVPKNRRRIQCGRVAVGFVARHNAAQMPVVRMNTLRGHLEVSSPEATAFDLVGYAEHCGGLDNVATVLAELGEKLDSDRLRSIARLSPLPWTQRLGFLLDQVGWSQRNGALATFVSAEVSETVLLSPSDAKEGSRREARWKLLVNTELESDVDSPLTSSRNGVRKRRGLSTGWVADELVARLPGEPWRGSGGSGDAGQG
jgi:predicted transcriptional regulator of viral defense system